MATNDNEVKKLQVLGNLVGPKGEDGHTPQKGTDYWTEEDRQSIIDDLLTFIPEVPQVDMNQNDSEASDYIKNRTHYTEKINVPFVEDTYVANANGGLGTWVRPDNYDEDKFPFEYTGDGMFFYPPEWGLARLFSDLSHVQTILMTVNGIEQTLIRRPRPEVGREEETYFGNMNIKYTEFPDTGEGFLIRDGGGGMAAILANCLPPSETVTLIAYYEGLAYNPIDEKFIPDTIARVSNIPAPYIILGDNATEFSAYPTTVEDWARLSASIVAAYENGSEIRVNRNVGTDTEVMRCVNLEKFSDGSIKAYFPQDNLWCYYLDIPVGAAGRMRSARWGDIPLANSIDEDRFLMSKDGKYKLVKPSDVIPAQIQSDYNQNDPTATDYVKNRTHYGDGEEIFNVTVAATTDQPSSTGWYKTLFVETSVGFVEGQKYSVICDGVEYWCVAESGNNGSRYIGIGNVSNGAWHGDGNTVDNGQPFIILDLYVGDDRFIEFDFYDNEPHTIKILSGEMKHLDEKYIPDSIARTSQLPEGVPSVTTSDNGKFLRVVDGAWAAVAVPNAEEASF